MGRLVGRVLVKQPPAYSTLSQFRTDLSNTCDRGADALFDLVDAVLATGAIPSSA